MAQKVLTGARARLFLNGKKLGFAMGVTVTENISQERIITLDNIRTTEFATTGITCQMRCRIYKIPNEDLVTSGLWVQAGTTPDEHKRLLLNFDPLTADVFDSFTNTYVMKVVGLVPTSRTFNVEARGVVVSDVTFEGISAGDEGSPSF